MSPNICKYVCMYVCTNMYMHMSVYIYIYLYIYLYIFMFMCINTCIYTYVYTYLVHLHRYSLFSSVCILPPLHALACPLTCTWCLPPNMLTYLHTYLCPFIGTSSFGLICIYLNISTNSFSNYHMLATFYTYVLVSRSVLYSKNLISISICTYSHEWPLRNASIKKHMLTNLMYA